MSSVPNVINFPFSVNSKELCPPEEVLAQYPGGLFLLASAFVREEYLSPCVLDFNSRKATGSSLSIISLQLATKLCLLLQKCIA